MSLCCDAGTLALSLEARVCFKSLTNTPSSTLTVIFAPEVALTWIVGIVFGGLATRLFADQSDGRRLGKRVSRRKWEIYRTSCDVFSLFSSDAFEIDCPVATRGTPH